MSVCSSTAEINASVTAKSSLSRRKCRRTVQPAVSSAAAYSAKVGAGSSAVRGFDAHTSRKIRSAAPLPHRICAAGTVLVHCQLCPQSAAEGVRVAVCGGKRGSNGLCHPLRQSQRADIGRKVQRVLSVLRPVTGPVAAMYKLHHKIPRITSPSASASRLSAYIMRFARRISSGSMGRTASPMVGFL